MAMSSEQMAQMRETAQKNREANIHLYRGAPAVRCWSKHQNTVESWSLCGIQWSKDSVKRATEDAEKVTCEFCLQLLAPEYVNGSTVVEASAVVKTELAALWDLPDLEPACS